MITGNFSFWMIGKRNLQPLKATCERWWELVTSWLKFPFSMFDEENTDIRIVDLLAWQRQIERFNGESESLYRLRVKHAFVNAKDAGTPNGMRKIFERLKLDPNPTFEERVAGYDWDQIGINLKMSVLGRYQSLLDVLMEQYGRTCRRWLYHTMIDDSIGVVFVGISVVNEETIVYPDNTIPTIMTLPTMITANVISGSVTVYPST